MHCRATSLQLATAISKLEALIRSGSKTKFGETKRKKFITWTDPKWNISHDINFEVGYARLATRSISFSTRSRIVSYFFCTRSSRSLAPILSRGALTAGAQRVPSSSMNSLTPSSCHLKRRRKDERRVGKATEEVVKISFKWFSKRLLREHFP